MATVAELEVKFTAMEADNKKMKADIKKLQKAIRKLTKEPEDPDKPKKLSGFAKPMKLSAALTKFLGVPADTLMARTDVTKEINSYVKANNLQNPDNKREIFIDAKLKTIIDAPADQQVTFFNLQRFMSPHYIKESTVDPPAADVKSAPVAVPESTDTPKVKKIVKRVVKKA